MRSSTVFEFYVDRYEGVAHVNGWFAANNFPAVSVRVYETVDPFDVWVNVATERAGEMFQLLLQLVSDGTVWGCRFH